jgi:NTP pyrophosphatase (non-canonical NTP hydrolase)
MKVDNTNYVCGPRHIRIDVSQYTNTFGSTENELAVLGLMMVHHRENSWDSIALTKLTALIKIDIQSNRKPWCGYHFESCLDMIYDLRDRYVSCTTIAGVDYLALTPECVSILYEKYPVLVDGTNMPIPDSSVTLQEYEDKIGNYFRMDLSADEMSELACLGLAGEAGEVADLRKKEKFHKRSITLRNKASELSDVFFYLVMYAKAHGFTLSQVVQVQLAKLSKIHPSGKFTIEAMQKRRDKGEK